MALCIGLLLALGVFGANARLHAADQPANSHVQPGGDDCAVAWSASGVPVPLDVPAGLRMPLR